MRIKIHVVRALIFGSFVFIGAAACAQEYSLDAFRSVLGGGTSSNGDMTVIGLIQPSSLATSSAGDYSLVGEFRSVDIPRAAVVITPATTIFDNTGGSAAGYVGATTTTWLAEKFCLRTQSYGLESLTLLLVSADNGGDARGGEVRLRIYSNDPVTGKPGSDTGVNMVLAGRSNPITLPIGYAETPIEWRPATPFVLAPNQCYWAVLSTDVGIVVQPDTYAAADGDAGSFGRITSQDGGATWNSPDNFTSRKMLIRGVPLSSGPPPAVETLYVANGSDMTITKVTTNGVSSLFASTGPNTPYGLAFDRAGNLFVAVRGDKILRLTPEGAQSVFADTGLVTPEGLAFDGAGNLYVANTGNHTIAKFTPEGVGSVFAASGLDSPSGLAFDRAGNLYVANGNNRIMKFTPEGVGSLFATTGLYPIGLAFDRMGNLYAAIAGGYIIQKFTPDGVGSIFASSGLNATWGLAFDSTGNLYAANTGDSTIQKFKPDGTGSVFANTGLHSPNFIAFDHMLLNIGSPPTELRINAAEKVGNQLRLTFNSVIGGRYDIESLTELAAGKWETFVSSTNSSVGGTVQITLPIRLDRSYQFYRVHVLP